MPKQGEPLYGSGRKKEVTLLEFLHTFTMPKWCWFVLLLAFVISH